MDDNKNKVLRFRDVTLFTVSAMLFMDQIALAAGLDPERLHVTMVGLNHGCWGVEHDYDGADPLPLLAEAWERRR